ncbi:WG repeat-containing protein [Parabacteroides sp.]
MEKVFVYLCSLLLMTSCVDGGSGKGNLLENIRLFPVMKKERGNTTYAYVDPTGKEVFMSPFVEVPGLFYDGLAKGKISHRESKGGTWRYIDEQGNVVIDASDYIEASDFSEGIAWCEKPGGHWVAIDTSGKILFELGGKPMGLFSEGLAACRIGGKGVFVDKQGRVVLEPEGNIYEFSSQFVNGLCCVYQSNRYGAIDKTGKLVVDFVSKEPVMADRNGNVVVRVDGQCALVDKKSNILIPGGKFKDIVNDGKWYKVSEDGELYGWCDEKGNMKIEYKVQGGRQWPYDDLFLGNDYAYVQIGQKHFMMDRNGETKPAPSISLDGAFVNGCSFVSGINGVKMINDSWQKIGGPYRGEVPLNKSQAYGLFQGGHVDYAIR